MGLVEDHGKFVRRRFIDGLEAGPHALPAGNGVEREVRGDHPPEDEENDLDDIRPRDGRKATVQRIGDGEQCQAQDTINHRNPHDGLQRQGAEVQHRSEVDEDVERNPENRENGFELGGVAFLDKLRNGVQALLDENGEEVLSDNQQSQRCHPFVRGDGQSQAEARAGHPDELFSGDVRGDQRSADGPPRERFTREEIIFRALLLAVLAAGNVKPHAEDQRRVNNENDVVSEGKLSRHVSKG